MHYCINDFMWGLGRQHLEFLRKCMLRDKLTIKYASKCMQFVFLIVTDGLQACFLIIFPLSWSYFLKVSQISLNHL